MLVLLTKRLRSESIQELDKMLTISFPQFINILTFKACMSTFATIVLNCMKYNSYSPLNYFFFGIFFDGMIK